MSSVTKNLSKFGFVLFIQGLIYKSTGIINSLPIQSAREMQLPLQVDSLIPFIPEGIWPYCFYYLILVSGFLLAIDDAIFDRFLKHFILMSVVADLCFVILPVTVPLQSLPGFEGSLTGDLFKFILLLDTRSNCFPSLHCAHSFLITYWFSKSLILPQMLKHLLAIMTVMVVCATLFIKQHWFVDIVGAFILFIFISRIYERKLQNQSV